MELPPSMSELHREQYRDDRLHEAVRLADKLADALIAAGLDSLGEAARGIEYEVEDLIGIRSNGYNR